MRSFFLLVSAREVFAAIVLAALVPCAAHATGNVLLPPLSGNAPSSLPNLGVAPASPPAASALPAPAAPNLPQSMPGGQSQPVPDVKTIITSPVDAQTAAKLPPGAWPTKIIHLPDMTPMLAQLQAQQHLPYALTISIDGQSFFGADDVRQISDKLGLSRDQIPGACILTPRGFMQTSAGGAIIGGGNTPQAVTHYDGTIKGYFITATALCVADHVPPGAGFLTETGGRFVVTLQPIHCPAPLRQVSQLIITYTGDAQSSCSYQ